MPFYIRDSINLGPFKVNVSKSGLGISAGVKGFRIGAGPKGHYIHAGRNGVYYRKTLGSLGRNAKPTPTQGTDYTSQIAKIAPNEKLPTYMTEDGILMRRIISAEADVLVSESHSEALSSLNEARERPSYTLMLCGAAGIGLSLSFVSQNLAVIGLFAILLVAAYVIGNMIDVPRRNVVFAYDLEPVVEERYKAFLDAIDRIANAHKMWFVKAKGDITNLHAWKKNSGASELVDSKETAVSYALPKGIASNITPPMIVIDGKNCYFFPDCLLIEENKRFGAVRYENMRTAVRDQRMIMDSAPSDAKVVGQTWKYVNKNGSPDRRFNSNRQLPICLLEEIGMISEGGFKGLLQVSKHGIGGAYVTAITELGSVTKELKDAEPLLITKNI
ncbi:DUF4236 domain-containing protein [Rubellimicrobium aerolatum]|uniref:DUF4236 domain-containing protein n=1 Tax=Rubellimicrobium aerolatum TaxID=490979 RepID=A0ABW0SGP9_9RHOB|nr:DUF4236 domain-containing protein [Rubellimicrobium aerolatum]MBP1807446.1 hypothetical protein [Rubellimicrobium aerolatum]